MVNEASLTGESIPIIKGPFDLEKEVFDAVKHKNNLIYSGTNIL